ncbi:MAG: S1C family serine protease [Pirellulales bacterium]
MRMLTGIGCVLAVLLFGQSMAFGQESLEDVIERVEKSVIRIEVQGAKGASLGSGFVVDNRGTIVTNCHVLAGAQRAVAFFPNGRQAEIVGTMLIDETRDIVVGKISITDAPAIEISSGLPRKGERVVALGAPLGLAFSATNGIVSAIRSAEEMRSDVNKSDVDGTWIQVDAPLSPGNSGGPLINGSGKLVGMSTLASGGGRAQNLNFGISANDVRNAIKYAEGVVAVPLTNGVGRIKMDEDGPDNRPNPKGGKGGSVLARGKVPTESIAKYVNSTVRDYDKLLSGLRGEKSRLSSELTQMKNGKGFIPASIGDREDVVVKAKVPGSKTPTWFFAGEDVKKAVIERQQERIKKSNELSGSLKGKEDQKSVFELITNFGPPLDPKKNNSVGFARDIIVLHALDQHLVLAAWDDNPYVLYLESTAGLFPGEIISMSMMVSGTEVLVNPKRPGLTTSLTVLQEVPEEDIKQAIQSRLGFRTWRSGQHTVEAKRFLR